MKRRPSDWLKIVKMYVDDGVPMSKLAEKYHFNVSHLKHKVNVSLFLLKCIIKLDTIIFYENN